MQRISFKINGKTKSRLDCNLTEDMKKQYLLAANYNSDTKEGKEEIEKIFVDNNSELLQNLEKNGLNIDGRSKISIMESSIGLATIVTFIAIYKRFITISYCNCNYYRYNLWSIFLGYILR